MNVLIQILEILRVFGKCPSPAMYRTTVHRVRDMELSLLSSLKVNEMLLEGDFDDHVITEDSRGGATNLDLSQKISRLQESP